MKLNELVTGAGFIKEFLSVMNQRPSGYEPKPMPQMKL